MPTNDGFPAVEGFTSRAVTAAAGNQVTSASYNTIQDRAIATSDGLDAIVTKIHRVKNSSGTLLLAHLPDEHGGHTVWIVATTSDSSEVVIDADFDWRDRIVEIALTFMHPTTYGDVLPGETNDAELRGQVGAIGFGHNNFYSELGQDGTAGFPGTVAVETDTFRIYARDTDGALCVYKSGAADPEYHIIGRVSCSPRLNAVTL